MSPAHLTHLKPSMHCGRTLATVLALCGAFGTAWAQKPGPGGPGGKDGSTWGLGLGVMSGQKAYTGIDRDNKLLPVLLYENDYVRVFGPGIELKLPRLDLGGSQSLDFRLLAQYDGSGYEADDAPSLAGMAERKGGFWAGAKMTWHNDVADVNLELLKDAAGNSKGQRFSLGVEKTWRLGERVMLTPRLGAQWQDKKYVDYYYGVRASEVRAGRAAYAGDGGVNIEVGVRAMYRLDAHQALMLNVGVTRLDKGITHSPLVDRKTENAVMLGYMYRF